MYRQLEKNLLKSNISSKCPHNMVNIGPLTAEICWRVWSTPANFNGFRILPSLLHHLLGWYTIYIYIYILFSGLLPTNGILSGAKFTLRQSLAFSYIGSITAQH